MGYSDNSSSDIPDETLAARSSSPHAEQRPTDPRDAAPVSLGPALLARLADRLDATAILSEARSIEEFYIMARDKRVHPLAPSLAFRTVFSRALDTVIDQLVPDVGQTDEEWAVRPRYGKDIYEFMLTHPAYATGDFLLHFLYRPGTRRPVNLRKSESTAVFYTTQWIHQEYVRFFVRLGLKVVHRTADETHLRHSGFYRNRFLHPTIRICNACPPQYPYDPTLRDKAAFSMFWHFLRKQDGTHKMMLLGPGCFWAAYLPVTVLQKRTMAFNERSSWTREAAERRFREGFYENKTTIYNRVRKHEIPEHEHDTYPYCPRTTRHMKDKGCTFLSAVDCPVAAVTHIFRRVPYFMADYHNVGIQEPLDWRLGGECTLSLLFVDELWEPL